VTAAIAAAVTVLAMFFGQSGALAAPGDFEILNQDTMRIAGSNAAGIFEQGLHDIPGILRLYRPAGVSYSDYQVFSPVQGAEARMSFLAQVDVLGIHQSGRLVADVTEAPVNCEAPEQPVGIRVTMDLRASDRKLSDHLSYYLVDLCPSTPDSSGLMLSATGAVIEGPRSMPPLSLVAKAVFRKQLSAVLAAFAAEVDQLSHKNP
jgi:hypothetical protein